MIFLSDKAETVFNLLRLVAKIAGNLTLEEISRFRRNDEVNSDG